MVGVFFFGFGVEARIKIKLGLVGFGRRGGSSVDGISYRCVLGFVITVEILDEKRMLEIYGVVFCKC